MSRKEFQKRGPSLKEQLLDWVYKWLKKLGLHLPELGPGKGTMDTLQRIVLAGAIIGFLVIIFTILRLVNRRLQVEKVGALPAGDANPEQTPTEYLGQAAAFASQGEYRTALERAYLATLMKLGEEKALDYHPSRTNWENLRTLNRAFPSDLARRLRKVSRTFDRKWYGLEETKAEEYHQAAEDLALARQKREGQP